DLKREFRVSCYTDAGYLTDANDLKSQTRYVFVLNGGTVDWKSAKQSIFAASSAKAEYIATFDASKEAVWARYFISGLGVVPTIKEPISMYCNNTKAITIANELGITKGARHFRAKVHYLREVIEYGDVKLEKVHTDDNLADPFTKALAFPKHFEHTRNIGMLPASSLIKCGAARWQGVIRGLIAPSILDDPTHNTSCSGCNNSKPISVDQWLTQLATKGNLGRNSWRCLKGRNKYEDWGLSLRRKVRGASSDYKRFSLLKQEEGKSVSSYVLKMKGYIDNLEHLGHPMTLGLR
nr:hypothetical protein [Tanacetum cinerariifolium]